jgi:hypothetical protein
VGLALILLGGTMNTVDIIKAIPIPELADKLGIHLEFRGNGNPQMAICPFHDDHNPSFAYYPDTNTFRCFSIGCNKSGKAYQFIKDYAEKNNLKLSEVIKQMTEKIKVTGSVNLVTLKTLNPPFFKSENEALDYLMGSRLINNDTINHFEIQADIENQAWKYPLQQSRHTRYKTFDSNSGKKYWHDEGTPNQIYSDGLWDETFHWVNGEPAVWAMYEAGIPAGCGIYGEGKIPNDAIEILKEQCIKKIIIVPDNDKAGDEGAEKAYKHFSKDFEVEIRELPDYLQEKADLADLWIHFQGNRELFIQAIEKMSITKKNYQIHYSLDDIDKMEAKIERVWGNMFYMGSIHLLSGDPGVSKTQFLLNLATKASEGVSFLGIDFIKPLTIAYFDMEMSIPQLKSKTQSIEHKEGNVRIFFYREPCSIDDVEREIIKHNIDMVIIDPLTDFFEIENENDPKEVRKKFGKLLHKLKEKTQCCIIVAHHFGKITEGKSKVNKSRGSTAITGKCDVVINAEPDKNDNEVVKFEVVKNRTGNSLETVYTRKVDGEFQLIEKPDSTLTKTQLAEKEIFKLLNISNEPIWLASFIDHNQLNYQISGRTTQLALKNLVDQGEIEKISHGLYGLVRESIECMESVAILPFDEQTGTVEPKENGKTNGNEMAINNGLPFEDINIQLGKKPNGKMANENNGLPFGLPFVNTISKAKNKTNGKMVIKKDPQTVINAKEQEISLPYPDENNDPSDECIDVII